MSHATDILTHSRRYFDFADLESNTIDIQDIAQGLSNVCRFGGQCPVFYSVAQHSVLVYRILRDVLNVDDPVILKQGLLHDATEAFLGDMVSPLKRRIPQYKAIEARLNDTIMYAFSLPWQLSARVKEADLMALSIEQRELWGNADDWAVLEGVARAEWTLIPTTPFVARAQFMQTYTELFLR